MARKAAQMFVNNSALGSRYSKA